MKRIVIIIERCEQCPQFTKFQGANFSRFCNKFNKVIDFGSDIPEWCKLEDVE